MKLLVFSDIHIFTHKSSFQRLTDCLTVLKWVFQTARSRKIKNVIFAGDLFQNRQKIDTLSYVSTFEIIKEYNDLNIYLLVGNHDMWFYEKTDINSIKPFEALRHVQVIGNPSTVSIDGFNVDFLPYTHNPIEVIKSNWPVKSKVLFGHVAIDDAQLNKRFDTRSDISVENDKDMVRVDVRIFDEWDKVFLGHFHGEQKLNDKVEYIGSPLQLNFNEAFQDKHIIIFDTDTFESEYIKNNFSPKHLILPESELSNYDLKNNFVQVEVEDVASSKMMDIRNELVNEVQTVEFRKAKTRSKEIDKDKLQSKFDLTKGDVFERYFDTVGTGNLDRAFLLELAKEICQSEN